MNQLSQTTKLSETLTVSSLMGGLWQIADMERRGETLDPDKAAVAMHAYVEKSVTTFDMADHYGSAELIVGSYHRQYGDQNTQFLTKWVPKPGPSSKQEVRTAVTKALDRMQTDSIDLLQFHAWNYADPSWLDIMFWIQELKQEGLIKNLGVTNFDAAHLHIAVTSGIEVVSNQVCYSILDQRAAGEMASVCDAFNVKILAFGVLAGGFISEKWLNQEEPDVLHTWSQMKYKRFIDAAGGWKELQRTLEVLNKLAEDKNSTIANLAMRYILDDPNVGGIIIGARLGESEHIEENLKVYRTYINEEERAIIRESISGLHPIPGRCGDEYRKPPFLTASGDLSHHISEMPSPYKVIEKAGKKQVHSGTIWEDTAGFSRAVMTGNRIRVSGTTASHGKRAIGGADPVAQTHFIIDKIEGALQSFGASLDDVVRTRIYVKHLDQWEIVAKVHGQRFGSVQPANTMIQANLIGDENLVEIEAEAEVMGTREQLNN